MLYLRVSPGSYQTYFQFNLSLMLFINLIKHKKKTLFKLLTIINKSHHLTTTLVFNTVKCNFISVIISCYEVIHLHQIYTDSYQ